MVDTKFLAQTLEMTEEELVHEGLRSFLQERLRLLTAEYRARCARFGVSSLEELDQRIRQGEITEEASWEDFQQIDYLVEQIERIGQLLESI